MGALHQHGTVVPASSPPGRPAHVKVQRQCTHMATLPRAASTEQTQQCSTTNGALHGGGTAVRQYTLT